MTRFFDASAVVRGYTQHAHQGRVRAMLRDEGVAISRLSEVEVVSAFERLNRATAMTGDERDHAARTFVADLDRWVVVDLTPEVTARARELLVRHPLRAGDAVQLASALVLGERLGEPLEAFVASDRRLLDAARRERLSISES